MFASITQRLVVGVLSVLTVAFASAAWAVTGNTEISVTGSGGNPLPRTTVRLISTTTGTTVASSETNESGSVVIPVEEGTYIVEVGEGQQKTRTEITVTGGQTTPVRVSIPDLPTSPPPFPRTVIAYTYGNEEEDDYAVTSSVDRITDTINGEKLPVQTVPGDPVDLNQRRDFELNWNHNSATFGTRLGGKKFVPYIYGRIGRADVTFRNNNLLDPSRTSTFEGDGLTWGAGIKGFGLAESGFFGGGGYEYEGFDDLRLTRESPLQVAGGTVNRDEFRISYGAHQIRAFAGYRIGVVYPYAGVAFWSRRVEIRGDIEVDSSPVQAIRRIESTSKFEGDITAGLVGVSIRAGHFVGGAEGTFSGGSKTYRINAGLAF